ncbi:MAG: vWA domain-containing protein, partial [Beijerinckiaceae bacterium]
LARVADAMFGDVRDREEQQERPDIDFDATMTISDLEVFKSRDFEKMTALEITDAKRAIQRLILPDDHVKSRRFQSISHGGRIDPRRTLRASLRGGGGMIDLRRRAPQTKRPPIVAICDISGSMADYSRIFLHFLHALSKSGRPVHAFTFATQLTNVTRLLKSTKDPEIALQECGRTVKDWDGGTRIYAALETFNKRWARRVLGGGAVVLFISDGLERRMNDILPREMARLKRSSRRLIWLNPLLRYDAFEAKAEGIRALLPHVHEFRPVHSLNAMEELCQALSVEGSAGADPRKWL